MNSIFQTGLKIIPQTVRKPWIPVSTPLYPSSFIKITVSQQFFIKFHPDFIINIVSDYWQDMLSDIFAGPMHPVDIYWVSIAPNAPCRYLLSLIAPNLIKNGKQLSHYWVKSSNVDDIQSFGLIHFFLKHRILGRDFSRNTG